MATGDYNDPLERMKWEMGMLQQQLSSTTANSLSSPLGNSWITAGTATAMPGAWSQAQTAIFQLPIPRQLPPLDMKQSISVQVTLNNDYQLHSVGTDPAVIYADGRKEYYIKGVRVPEFVVTQPERIKVDDINKETNVEVRRIMMERYGLAKYLQNSKAKLVDEDEFGKLWRVEVPLDEALVMVQVRNSTAEPDGTFKDYWLRVPPQMTSPAAAIAWTFRLDPGTYDPVIQT